MDAMTSLAHLSVVIPTYNGRALLEKHLPDVKKILDPGDEIIIVDDASTDDTLTWLTEQKPAFARAGIDLIPIAHATNQRFAAAVNTGTRAAHHPHVLLLNSDVSPLSKDLKKQLLSWFDDEAMFAVGCAEVTKDTPNARVSGRGTGGWHRGLMAHWYDPDQTKTDTLWTSGGSMMFDRQKFLDLGGMDTLFSPAYQEDRDLSYRALKHGLHIAFDPQALVLHQHESTNKTALGNRAMEVASWKNQFLIVWKNITDRRFLLQHFLWLPFHLVVTNFRTGGTLGAGFWRALWQLPLCLKKRKSVNRHTVRKDTDLLVMNSPS